MRAARSWTLTARESTVAVSVVAAAVSSWRQALASAWLPAISFFSSSISDEEPMGVPEADTKLSRLCGSDRIG
jgi:hypothetical protein